MLHYSQTQSGRQTNSLANTPDPPPLHSRLPSPNLKRAEKAGDHKSEFLDEQSSNRPSADISCLPGTNEASEVHFRAAFMCGWVMGAGGGSEGALPVPFHLAHC